MTKNRNNHFVPEWYQKGFTHERNNELCHLTRKVLEHNNKTIYSKKWFSCAQKFYQKDLYSTFFGTEVNDDIEKKFFGFIDDNGSKAIRAFLTDDQSQWHHNFENFFTYLDAQKLRTPKGLDWIRSKYSKLSQLQLMQEMQSLQYIHCTIWAEGVREFVSAENSKVKFIVSDHPVTIYNPACPPESELCKHPSTPDITFKGSQTIFPLSKNRCLILTNLEYAEAPNQTDPLEQRTNATRLRQSMVNTIEFINIRKLTCDEVSKINLIIKRNSQSSIAAGKKEWLYPENNVSSSWAELQQTLLPPPSELHNFRGEMYVRYKDNSVYYQDAFGRTSPKSDYLKKEINENTIGRNDQCGCGSGRKYKHCCYITCKDNRTTWSVLSIRERNLAFCNCIRDVLGLNKDKIWLDVRRELSDEQVSKIYKFYSILWPRETDIYSLLPKPDGKFRGLYTGILDVRTIDTIALPMASMFEEFLIESPITNPNNVKTEFNPIQSPSNYKYQALKDFLFILQLEPFIERGTVNLVPSPTEFDSNLMKAQMSMAEKRNSSSVMHCDKDRETLLILATEDFLNSIALMPTELKIESLKEQFNVTQEIAIKIISETERNSESSPLSMLQPLKSVGGQLILSHMRPNYEMSLFLAQGTGSVLVTDSKTRWNELMSASHREKGIVIYPWQDAIKHLREIPIDYQFIKSALKSKHLFNTTRNIMAEIDHIILENSVNITTLDQLSKKISDLNFQLNQSSNSLDITSLKILSPDGGFYDTNIQRLLARSNCQRYDQNVRSIYGIGLPV